jgi:hypothetical protein
MKKSFSWASAVYGAAACLWLYASTKDLGLSMAAYLALVSINLAVHSAARARAVAERAGRPEGRAAHQRPRRRGSFPRVEK